MDLIFSALFAALGSLLLLTVVAQDYSIAEYGVIGTGCVPGSVSADITSGGKNIAVKYNSFVANAGPAYGYDDNRKNCQLTLSVKTPAGYQFAFDKFSFNGSYAVAANVKASFTTSYYFQSSLDQSQGGDFFVGPAKADSVFADIFSPAVWSPCGGTNVVGINTALRVDNSDNGGASGALIIRTAPAAANFIWRKC